MQPQPRSPSKVCPPPNRRRSFRARFLCRCGLELFLESAEADPTDDNGGCPRCGSDRFSIRVGATSIA